MIETIFYFLVVFAVWVYLSAWSFEAIVKEAQNNPFLAVLSDRVMYIVAAIPIIWVIVVIDKLKKRKNK